MRIARAGEDHGREDHPDESEQPDGADLPDLVDVLVVVDPELSGLFGVERAEAATDQWMREHVGRDVARNRRRDVSSSCSYVCFDVEDRPERARRGNMHRTGEEDESDRRQDLQHLPGGGSTRCTG